LIFGSTRLSIVREFLLQRRPGVFQELRMAIEKYPAAPAGMDGAAF
jgi:hypothetical protein